MECTRPIVCRCKSSRLNSLLPKSGELLHVSTKILVKISEEDSKTELGQLINKTQKVWWTSSSSRVKSFTSTEWAAGPRTSTFASWLPSNFTAKNGERSKSMWSLGPQLRLGLTLKSFSRNWKSEIKFLKNFLKPSMWTILRSIASCPTWRTRASPADPAPKTSQNSGKAIELTAIQLFWYQTWLHSSTSSKRMLTEIVTWWPSKANQLPNHRPSNLKTRKSFPTKAKIFHSNSIKPS